MGSTKSKVVVPEWSDSNDSLYQAALKVIEAERKIADIKVRTKYGAEQLDVKQLKMSKRDAIMEYECLRKCRANALHTRISSAAIEVIGSPRLTSRAEKEQKAQNRQRVLEELSGVFRARQAATVDPILEARMTYGDNMPKA